MTSAVVVSLRSDLHMQGEEYDEFDAIADYIFQVTRFFPWQQLTEFFFFRGQNSNATSVLMHHQDIADIRAVGCLATTDFTF